MSLEFLHKKGGYRGLRVFVIAEIICDLTAFFVDKFVPSKSRTRDQKEQAARSGKQNIVEGSKASMTSVETEIKLTNVAKASLEELKLDYEDYLRQHGLNLWEKTNSRTIRLRNYLKSDDFMQQPMKLVSRMTPEEYCNLCITLISQATYMLDRLLLRQQEQFLTSGGIREQMTKGRISYRSNQTYRTYLTAPTNRNGGMNADKSDLSDLSDQSD